MLHTYIDSHCLSALGNRQSRASSVPLPPPTQLPPCSPVQVKPNKVNHSQQLYQTAQSILFKIGNSIDNANDSFPSSIPSMPTVPTYATPSLPPTITPTTTSVPIEDESVNEIVIYKFISLEVI